ncbi:MAG: hypothetical protein HY209_01100 [Candidatus Omnitrophica bacterium]|nr:hypothetical protein [Candidatus Omnitrophota bacterium]
MRALLILKGSKTSEKLRIIVKLNQKDLKDRVITLLEENKDREAFDILYKEAQVETYLAPGERIPIRPVVTLSEEPL